MEDSSFVSQSMAQGLEGQRSQIPFLHSPSPLILSHPWVDLSHLHCHSVDSPQPDRSEAAPLCVVPWSPHDRSALPRLTRRGHRYAGHCAGAVDSRASPLLAPSLVFAVFSSLVLPSFSLCVSSSPMSNIHSLADYRSSGAAPYRAAASTPSTSYQGGSGGGGAGRPNFGTIGGLRGSEEPLTAPAGGGFNEVGYSYEVGGTAVLTATAHTTSATPATPH